ncbi:amidinotransferase [Paraburkholderia panacisoli]|uniref:Amidinotransferase n=1 Tax=Paraburkholderia panacisoli TaxID=2603818 RepID=A0A5B0GB20_9BURK|nr:arginine deiminase-related protein [Paraburkholderia panacisoli]KAA0999965.1 amidinotransferase [Paraburkholderia panacisoli]
MSTISIQAPSAVIVIRPHCFHPNPETAADNAFQRAEHVQDHAALATAARNEVTAAAAALEKAGIRTHVFDDHGERQTPDSVFPNNWLSTHAGGHIALYPMHCANRRRERRADVVEMLKAEYRVQDVIDYSGLEYDGVFLEGTGAMVLDHVARVAYTARSRRADPVALERFCTHFNFEPMCFDTADRSGSAVYHTNVMMSIGTEFALVGLDLISNASRREEVQRRLLESGRTVIALDHEQIDSFAGNTLELTGSNGRVLALSERGAESLRPQQRAQIERSARLLPLRVPTIEMAGGSVRCMLAGIHLARRQRV